VSARLTMDGAIARLTLERPEALNALNREVAAALEDSLGQLERARDVSVVVLSGRGRAFCAGNDIAEMPALSPGEAEALSQRWQDIMDRFARLPQVTIAAVQGYALGGGCMLAAAQDLRIAETGATFGLPEITLGFNPSYGIARLLDVVGGGHARELLLTGRTIDAAEALRMGLVTRVVPDGTLERAAAGFAAEVARHPRGGLAATKAIVADIRAGRSGDAARAYAAALRADPEARARIAAFVAKKRRG
jgi:enoyl-CoA hydratase/carnithine racemase